MIPKHLHLYWGGGKKLSYLRYLTVFSFVQLNPDWKITVWYPEKNTNISNWKTNEHSKYCYNGIDYFYKLIDISPNVSLEKANMVGFSDLSEVHKSDLHRWKILHEIGGWWSDFDILYFKPMASLNVDFSKVDFNISFNGLESGIVIVENT